MKFVGSDAICMVHVCAVPLAQSTFFGNDTERLVGTGKIIVHVNLITSV